MDGPIPTASNRIYATLPNNVFTSPPSPIDGGTPVLTLMAFCQRTREFYWYRDKAFYDAAKKNTQFNFDFDPLQLVPTRPSPESVFIVSQLGTLRSEALWLPANVTDGS
jgi:hypothetical protein